MDCAGGDIAKQQAVRCTAPWGRIALVAVGGNLNVVGWNDMIVGQRTVIGSWTFSINGMKDCAEFIADHGVEVDKVFSDRWDIEEAEKAYQMFDKQTGGKGVFVF
ncbi:Zinc-containing alcohol dehydrogenase superfamily protein [Salipiger bermudensis HTCC2601]|uniref:Zinc-containing alcohol dehydrogenase superfamily protein n=2 Tax=Salipiger TaxID=263377 RepID=Q0FWA1_SALBH|nr:Zinc-containing alcohol dehydrogenase superfamily protein [Salipiger bermudensis HTCC2601]